MFSKWTHGKECLNRFQDFFFWIKTEPRAADGKGMSVHMKMCLKMIIKFFTIIFGARVNEKLSSIKNGKLIAMQRATKSEILYRVRWKNWRI